MLGRYTDGFESLSEDQKEDFVSYRYQLGDALSDVATIMGGAYCLKLIGGQMAGEMNQLMQVW